MRRVAVFSSEYPPHVEGGLGVHVGHMTAALAGRVGIDLFVPKKPGYRSDLQGLCLREVEVPPAATHHEFWSAFCRASATVARRLSPLPDLLHCHDWMTVLAGILLKVDLGLPLAFHVHLPQTVAVNADLESLGLAAADLVIVNSEAVRRELESRPLQLRRLEVLPNGVDAQTFQPQPDWPQDDGYLLFVGRLVAQKGVDLLLRAFGAVLRRCPESRLVIVGDGELELFLKRLSREMGFPDRVSFLGWRTGGDLVEIYQRAQVVVVPSYYEPFGIVALEAMACGRPVVGARVGGLEEIVISDEHGLLFEPGDYLDLARRLAVLILDPERRRRMGAAARERAGSFRWEAIAGRMAGLYEELERDGAAPLREPRLV